MSTKEKTEVGRGVGALGKERVEGEPGPKQMCQDCAVFGPRVGPRQQQQQRVCVGCSGTVAHALRAGCGPWAPGAGLGRVA